MLTFLIVLCASLLSCPSTFLLNYKKSFWQSETSMEEGQERDLVRFRCCIAIIKTRHFFFFFFCCYYFFICICICDVLCLVAVVFDDVKCRWWSDHDKPLNFDLLLPLFRTLPLPLPAPLLISSTVFGS